MSTTWREALLIASENARMRCHNSAPLKSGPGDPETLARAAGAQYAFRVMADELHYIATLPPHEGLAALRKLSRRPR